MKHCVVTRKATGLGSDLVSVAGAFFYARNTGRNLVIDWRNSLYLDNGATNLFPLLFEIPDTIDGVDIFMADGNFDDGTLAPPLKYCKALDFKEYHEEMLCSPRAVRESIVVTRPMHHLPSEEMQKNIFSLIHPKKPLLEQIEAYRREHFGEKRMAGIHIRHGNGEFLGEKRDLLILRGIQHIVDKCTEILINASPQPEKVFICTDSQELRDALSHRFPDSCYYASTIGTRGEGAIHNSRRGLRGVEDALMEMWLLSYCDTLVYNPSWFSHYARITGRFSPPPVNIDQYSDYGTMQLYEKRLQKQTSPGPL